MIWKKKNGNQIVSIINLIRVIKTPMQMILGMNRKNEMLHRLKMRILIISR